MHLSTKKTSDNKERLAYLAFVYATAEAEGNLEKNNCFTAVSVLVRQLVHNPETRTAGERWCHCVLSRVSAPPHDGWLQPEQHQWDNVMTKMRAWEMKQYDRILMLDGDSMLVKSLDPVFNDPAGQLLATKPSDDNTLPPTYLLASNSEVWDSTHDFPPGHGTGLKKPGYMNAGFFMLAPSLDAFEHYKSLIDTPHSFDSQYPEQNLLNFVHRWDSPIP